MTILNRQNMSIKPNSGLGRALFSLPHSWMLAGLCWPLQGGGVSPKLNPAEAGFWKTGGNASLCRLFLREAAELWSKLGKWRKDMDRNSRHFPDAAQRASLFCWHHSFLEMGHRGLRLITYTKEIFQIEYQHLMLVGLQYSFLRVLNSSLVF